MDNIKINEKVDKKAIDKWENKMYHCTKILIQRYKGDVTMSWQLTADRPIYLQLIEEIELRIVSGMYTVGEKLPGVRDLAAQASVNPNTMQKALTELERQGLVYSQRTAGRFITEDSKMIQNLKNQLATDQILDFFKKMNQLGFTKEETIKLMQQLGSKEDAK